MAAIGGFYPTPEVRMRGVNQPLEVGGLGSGSGQSVRVGDLLPPESADKVNASNFGDILAAGIEQTNELQHVSDGKAEAFARGALDDLHGTMISAKEAEISLRMVGTVRTKLLDAFHELWRINV